MLAAGPPDSFLASRREEEAGCACPLPLQRAPFAEREVAREGGGAFGCG